MAWMVSVLVVLGILAAVFPAVRRLGLLAGAGLAWTGAMGVLLDADRPFTGLALAVGGRYGRRFGPPRPRADLGSRAMASTRVAVASALFAGAVSFVALWLVTDAGVWGLTGAHELPVDVAIGLSYSAAAVLVLSGTGGRRMGWLLLVIGLLRSYRAARTARRSSSPRPGRRRW